jgi:DNA-binding beta-propeller fold protein YncE
MKKLCLIFMLFVFTGLIYAVKVVPMPDVTYPRVIVIEDDHMYIAETSTVYIYSLKDFKLIKKFGKVGEGPGEFIPPPQKYPLGISVSKDHLLVASRGRLSYFTKNGDYVKEIKIKDIRPKTFYPFGDTLFGNSVRTTEEVAYITFNLTIKSLKILKPFTNTRTNGILPFVPQPFRPIFILLPIPISLPPTGGKKNSKSIALIPKANWLARLKTIISKIAR